MITIVEPVILSETRYNSRDYRPPLEYLLRQAQAWWEQYGVEVYFATIKDPPVDLSVIDLESANPWAQALTVTQGLSYPPEHRYLMLLEGWISAHGDIGWGGPPAALVGDYALRALLTMGTPEAVMDNDLAAGLICHEIGHVLGLQHDTGEDRGIMWSWWKWPNVALKQKPLAVSTLMGAISQPATQSCPRLPHA